MMAVTTVYPFAHHHRDRSHRRSTGIDVRELCTVLLEFQGGIVRRHLQEVGDLGEVSAPPSLSIKLEGVSAVEEEEESGCQRNTRINIA